MNTEQIMDLADRYADWEYSPGSHRERLQTAIEALAQERDHFEVDALMMTGERDALRESRDTYQREADKLAAECKVLRDALERLARLDYGNNTCTDIAIEALTRSKS